MMNCGAEEDQGMSGQCGLRFKIEGGGKRERDVWGVVVELWHFPRGKNRLGETIDKLTKIRPRTGARMSQ